MFTIITTKATDADDVKYTRPALIYKKNSKVMDYPYIWACTFAEFNTAEEYLKILRRFANYLLTRANQPFDEKAILDFWLYATAGDIRSWQQLRVDNITLTKKGAKWETIEREAEIVTQFMLYVSKCGERMLFNPRSKTILSRTNAENSMLKGMVASRKQKDVAEYEDIRIPRPIVDAEDTDYDDIFPEEAMQLPNNFGYLPAFQIDMALGLFSDPVYVAISLAGLHTGLRNFEALGIPAMTAGLGFVSSPGMLRKKLRGGHVEMNLNVKGKGSKTRSVPIDIETWLGIMEFWWPEYESRKRQYKEKTGKDLPARVLWITKQLEPLYCDPENKTLHKIPLDRMQKAFYYISKKMKGCTEYTHGFSFNYYKFRHTFATLFFYDAMEKADNLDGARWLSDMSIRNELRERMGHSLLSTTIQNYVESAIFLHLQKTVDAKRWFPDAMAHLDKITADRSSG